MFFLERIIITNKMNENELYVVFNKVNHECIYGFKLTNITINEINNSTIRGKSVNLSELNKNLKVARQIVFIINQMNKLINNYFRTYDV